MIDASIPMGVRGFDASVLMDGIGDGLRLRDLAAQAKQRKAEAEYQNQQRNRATTLQGLYSQAVKPGANGVPEIDRKGLLGGLMQGGFGQEALAAQGDFAQQDSIAAEQARKAKAAKEAQKAQWLGGYALKFKYAKDPAQKAALRQRMIAEGQAMGEDMSDTPNEIGDGEIEMLELMALDPETRAKVLQDRQKAQQDQKNKDAELEISRKRLEIDSKKAENPTETYTTVVDPKTGNLVQVGNKTGGSRYVPSPGGGALQGEPKPATEGQSNAALYGRRLELAMADMDRIAQKFDRSKPKAGLESMLPDALQSGPSQEQANAERNFLTATLRRESGASISPSEFDTGEKLYFPRAGDSPGVLEQKRRNREQAFAGIKAAAGKAWDSTQSMAPTLGAPVNPAPAGAVKSHPQDSAAVTWAKQNPNDPRAQKILELNGGK